MTLHRRVLITIAAVGAAVGAAFGGALGVTASAGPGVVLKAETVGLAIALELPLVILDIQRAGQYEWSYGAARDLRVLRDIYPPRILLRFRRVDANGNVIAEGDRRLADLAYLMSPPPLPASDTLRYEKRLIDQWVRREFVTRR